MTDIKIAGIMRAGAYSPNHIGNDAAIFNATADQLRKRGCIVSIYSEEQFIAGEVKEDIIINMCREMKSIHLLQKREDEGALVINSGYGIENCTRERMTRILVGSGIPYPESLIVNTNEGVTAALKKGNFTRCWIKRGVINRHLEGDLIKFYGVQDTSFFFWFYPFDAGHSKYGHEAINGKSQGIGFDKDNLRDICRRAGEALDVKIYGGDCIVSPDGTIRIIDFNDWPSFAPCRQEAAPYIAKCILNTIKDRK